MSWNSGGSGGGSGNESGSGSGNGGRPESPWGNPGGARPGSQRPGSQRPSGGGPRGPWGGGGGGQPPDLDELIARLQNFLRGLIPPGFGGGPRGGGGGSTGGRGTGFPAGRGLLLLIVLVLIGWGATGFYRVQPDEQGVVLRFGAYNRTTFPGLNYHIPWPVESVLLPAVTRVNRVEIGYRSQGGRGGTTSSREVTTEGLMLTGDENIVDINFTVFWRIRDAEAYLFATRNPEGTVKSAAESEMREVIGRTPIQPALTDARASIEAAVKKGVQGMMDQYGSGVEITQVQLQKVDPPAAVIESFRDVQRAQTDAERLRNEADTYRNDIVPRARGDAARVVAEADAARQVSVAKATGETERFLSVLKSYEAAKDVTMKRLYLETMEDILAHTPSVIVDDRLKGIVPYLPLTGAGAGGADAAKALPAPAAVLKPELESGTGASSR